MMKEKVVNALEKIRPMLMADGGNVDLVEVTPDGVVKLKLTGTDEPDDLEDGYRKNIKTRSS